MRIELEYCAKHYTVDLDGAGKAIRVRVAYRRVHGLQNIGVLRTVHPMSDHRTPNATIKTVITKAEASWKMKTAS